MSVHLKPIGAESIVAEVRVYDSDDAGLSYNGRDEYKAVCTAVYCPVTQEVTLEAMHGEVTRSDMRGVFESLYQRYKVARVRWEHKSKQKQARRISERRWVIVGDDESEIPSFE